MLKFIFTLLVTMFAQWSFAFVQQELVPGGVALVPIQSNHNQPPLVYFNNNRVTVTRDPSNQQMWLAVVGIPLGQNAGQAKLQVVTGDDKSEISINIKEKAYRSENIQVQQKFVTPPAKVINRIQDEAMHLNRILSAWQMTNKTEFNLLKPVEGRVSSEFGVHRVLNGQPRSFHKGIDYAAPIGTPIRAAQHGVVVEVGDYYYTGNTVVIDHGQTFKTIYCHLNSIDINKGDIVAKGEHIGKVGKTGRASGPHLHFGVSLNNARISPELFFAAV
jgi:murein DD-endopeptidase MepM/ murein hydrolase activator NlpD